MKDLIVNAELTFNESAKNSFKFPINNSIRISFWLFGDVKSTFSEIQVQEKSLEVGKMEVVEIKIGNADFLLDRIESGTLFNVGVFPNEIALGKIVSYNWSGVSKELF